jgi:MoaE-MoaD fusion protein
MQIHVLLFASLREAAGGARDLHVSLPCGSTAAAVIADVQCRFPRCRPILARCAVAVNAEYCDHDRALRDDDEVALIPPVSGG